MIWGKDVLMSRLPLTQLGHIHNGDLQERIKKMSECYSQGVRKLRYESCNDCLYLTCNLSIIYSLMFPTVLSPWYLHPAPFTSQACFCGQRKLVGGESQVLASKSCAACVGKGKQRTKGRVPTVSAVVISKCQALGILRHCSFLCGIKERKTY